MSNHKKTKSVTVRFTQYDYETLKIRAEEDRTSISDYIRQNVKLEFIIL
ncbi:plasmid mobilization protein [Winogradskyella sp. A3E31]